MNNENIKQDTLEDELKAVLGGAIGTDGQVWANLVAFIRSKLPAVAEGVDTVELRELLKAVTTASKRYCGEEEANQALFAHITTYGAQQREAGRLEVRASGLTNEQQRKAIESAAACVESFGRGDLAVTLRAIAALTRQPVSEGLTEQQRKAIKALIEVAEAAHTALDDSERRTDDAAILDGRSANKLELALEALDEFPDDKPGYTMSGPGRAEWALRAILSAVPPAKAEGMSEKLESIAESWDGCMYEAVGETLDIGAVLRNQFAATLAQQAKKGGAA